MRKLLLLFCLIQWTLTGLAQQRDTKTTQYNSRSIEIARSRTILLDRFIEKDELAVMLELDRVMMLEDDDYVALYPIEYWLLSYWLKDYDVILTSCKALKADSLIQDRRNIRIPPQQDYLGPKLIEKLSAVKDSLINQIRVASLTDEEKAFLQLNLEYLLHHNSERRNEQQELNNMADAFLTLYPASDYAHFTRQFIRIQYKETRNGAAYSIYGGKFLFTGNLQDYYTHPTVIGFSADVVQQNWLFQLHIAFGLNKTKADMPVNNTVWPKNAKATGGYMNLTAGKYVVDQKKFALAPVAGIGIFGIDPNDNTKERPELKGAGIRTSIAGSLGLIGDFKLKTKKQHETSYYPGVINTTFIRLSYELIASPLKNNFVDYSGAVHKITIGIGGSSRKLTRSF